jgi:hypothetical protein
MPEDTSRGTRRAESHKELKKAVGHIVKSIDNYITENSGDPKIKKMLKKYKPGLMKRLLKYEEVINNIEDDEVAISAHTESIAFIGVIFMIGTLMGSRMMGHHNMRQLRDGFRENTANGRRVALEKKSLTISRILQLKSHVLIYYNLKTANLQR